LNAAWVARARQRLQSLSWFMKCLKEALARLANRQEQTLGAFLDGKFKGKTVLGIYQLEGEELKIYLPKQGDTERPLDVKSPEGSDLAFMTFKRSKE
jgi:hypothetical protein